MNQVYEQFKNAGDYYINCWDFHKGKIRADYVELQTFIERNNRLGNTPGGSVLQARNLKELESYILKVRENYSEITESMASEFNNVEIVMGILQDQITKWEKLMSPKGKKDSKEGQEPSAEDAKEEVPVKAPM